MLGIGYEVLVVRVLSQVTENTVYTFATLLAIYLLGTALGAVVSGTVIQSVGLANLSWVGAPFGLAALLTLAFDRAVPNP